MDDTEQGRVEPGVWERAVELSAMTFRQPIAVYRLVCGTTVLAALAALGLAVLVREAAAAAVLDGLLLAGAVLTAAWRFRDPRLRASLELYLDHDAIEAAEHLRETGTPRPRRREDYVRWLEEHRDGPGRISKLGLLGRFDEADAEWVARPPVTAEDRFLLENHRAARVLHTGGRPDLRPAAAAWAAIDDPAARRHRRECLAIQEAMATVAADGDPTPVLAAARVEVGWVSRRAQTEWVIVSNGILVLLAVCTGWLIRLFLAG